MKLSLALQHLYTSEYLWADNIWRTEAVRVSRQTISWLLRDVKLNVIELIESVNLCDMNFDPEPTGSPLLPSCRRGHVVAKTTAPVNGLEVSPMTSQMYCTL